MTLRDASLTDCDSTRFAYAIGDPLGQIGPGVTTVAVRIALTFPDTAAASAAKDPATGWVVEAH
jgi:hypothetical protein